MSTSSSQALRALLILALAGLAAGVPAAAQTGLIFQLDYFATGFEEGMSLPIPSIDPAGVAFHTPSGHLFISDSEINEIPEVWAEVGANVFEVSTGGNVLYGAYDSGNSEPTGITWNAFDDHFYISNDNSATIHRYSFDGASFTEVDSVSTLPDAEDPEGIASDPRSGQIYIIDGGKKIQIYEYSGAFVLLETLSLDDPLLENPPYGIPTDPEGIAFDAESGHLLVVSGNPADNAIFEYTTAGSFVARYPLNPMSPRPIAAQGAAVMPVAGIEDRTRVFLPDGRIDNNQDPEERDGILYQARIDPTLEASRSADFTATTAYARVAHDTGLFPAQITVAAWIRPELTGPDDYILSAKQSGGYSLGLNITEGGASHPNVATGRAMVDGAFHNIYGQTLLPPDVWSHVAMTFDGTAFRLYVNGAEDAMLEVSGSLTPSPSSSLFFGGDSGGTSPVSGRYFRGLIDEVLVLESALSEPEIADLMAGEIDPGQPFWPDILGFWQFDFDLQGVVPDMSPSGFDAELLRGASLVCPAAPTADADDECAWPTIFLDGFESGDTSAWGPADKPDAVPAGVLDLLAGEPRGGRRGLCLGAVLSRAPGERGRRAREPHRRGLPVRRGAGLVDPPRKRSLQASSARHLSRCAGGLSRRDQLR